MQILGFIDRNMDEMQEKFCFYKRKSLERDLQILGFVDRNMDVKTNKYFKLCI